MFLQVAETVQLGAEPRAGLAEDGIAAPAEVAELQILAGVPKREDRLQVARFLVALDQVIADQHNPVALLELELRWLGSGSGPHGEAGPKRQRRGEKEESSHVVAPDRSQSA